MKNLFTIIAVAAGLCAATQVSALEHGSLAGVNAPLYLQYKANPQPATPEAGKTLDFKLVTIGQKTWAWTKINGSMVDPRDWASQLRYRQPNYNQADENNLVNRIGTTISYGIATKAMTINPLKVSIYQAPNGNTATEAMESATYNYDRTKPNSKNASDTEKPVMGECSYENLLSTKVDLKLAATDDSGLFFYYIEDAANGIADVTFFDEYPLPLSANKSYNVSITAIDFSGNESEPFVYHFSTGVLEGVTSGVAKGLYFEISSTATQLTVSAKPVDTKATIVNGNIEFVKYGGSFTGIAHKVVEENWAGIPSYTETLPHSFALGDIIHLNLAYLLGPLTPPVTAEEWSEVYGWSVLNNYTITTGPNAGAPLIHTIGTAISSISSANADAPLAIEQSGSLISIVANTPVSAQLFAVNGGLVFATESNVINTFDFAKGLYILKVQDAAGNAKAFKVVVK